MISKKFLLGMAALTLVVGIMVSSCGGSDDVTYQGGRFLFPDDTTYSSVIKQAAPAANGDLKRITGSKNELVQLLSPLAGTAYDKGGENNLSIDGVRKGLKDEGLSDSRINQIVSVLESEGVAAFAYKESGATWVYAAMEE